MFIETPQIKWKKVAFEKANEAYDFERAFNGSDPEESFPDDAPAFMVYKGDVTVDGPASFGAEDDDDCTLFVIDGNLVVRGPLSVAQGDFEGFLYVTGDVVCDTCLCLEDAHFSVGGSLKVKDLLVTVLSDMGSMFVRKSLIAGAWLEGCPRSDIRLGAKPDARLLCMPGTAARGADPGYDHADALRLSFDPTAAEDASAALLPEFVNDGSIDGWAIRKAVLAGKPVLNGTR